MLVTHFPFFHGLPTVLVNFSATRPTAVIARRLLVDSGFTGKSAFVLSTADAARLRRRAAPTSQVTGALFGAHARVWVRCSVPALEFDASLMAISSELSSLNLPEGVDGLAGLSFLSYLERWGAERVASTDWAFFLAMRDALG